MVVISLSDGRAQLKPHDERLGVVEAAMSTDISSGDSLRESITKALTSPSEKEAERPKAKQGGFCSQALVRDTGATRGC
jgi:hypothetical protein